MTRKPGEFDVETALDLRLMKLTLLLLKERSVSRVAAQLSMSQPAVSALLKRARLVFNDQLLVRDGQGMVPTARGEEISRQLDRALSPLLGAISGNTAFDPSASQKRFHISLLSGFAEYLVPSITARLLHLAPHSGVDFTTPRSLEQITRDLGSGQLDLVIGNWPEPPSHLRFFLLCSYPFGCLLSADHPLAKGAITTDDYAAARHIAPDSTYESSMGPVKGRLSQLGLKRDTVVRLPDYQHIPEILTRTDLIFTSVMPYVEDLAARSGGRLVARAAPDLFRRMDLYMLWHDRNQSSGEHIWLRDGVRTATAEMQGMFRAVTPKNCTP